MGGRHRRPTDHSTIIRRIASGAVAASLTFSLFGAMGMSRPRETEEALAYRPGLVKVTPELPVPTVTIPPTTPTTTVEPTPEPVIESATVDPEPEPEPVAADYPSQGFGGVRPHVAYAGYLFADLFDIPVGDIGGVGQRPNASEHPIGLALDLMIDRDSGEQLAEYAVENMEQLRVKYVIYRQRINFGSGWKPMEDRGGITANHMDHVHVSFNP